LRISAGLGSLATLFFGLAIFAIAITPETGHGEDIGRPIAIAVLLPFLLISALLATGCGIGVLGLSRKGGRALPAIGLALTVLGLACAVAAKLAYA
jgi:hypothetical protein